MKKIEFAKGLSLPTDSSTQTFGIIARKGAGKSYAAGKLVEGLYENGDQFVVLSPLPNWFGLRLAADGKSPGLKDVVILGGHRGDIPLDPSAGALVANTILDSGRSFVLDVSQFSLGERKRFAATFGEQLWQRQKALEYPRPIHIVLEEAQLFIPQQIYKGDERMVGIWNEIVRLGRNCGIGVSLITQRPQSVAKEALTQVECLIVLQVNGVPEKKALKEWIVEKGADTNLLEELPFLQRGVAYIWSPQWLEHFGKHEILPKWTFDSGATPKGGTARVKVELKPLDLDALKTQMADTVKRLEENDPSALKKRIRELETQLSKKPIVETPVTVSVDRPVLKDSQIKALDTAAKKAADVVDRFLDASKGFAVQVSEVLVAVSKLQQPQYAKEADSRVHFRGAVKSPPAPFNIPKLRMTPAPGSRVLVVDEGIKLNRGAKAMLQALATRESLTKVQMATLAGLSPKSGTFSTYLSQLRSCAFIAEHGDQISLSEAGRWALGDDIPRVPQSTDELLRQWSSKLPGTVMRMLTDLVGVYPQGKSKEALGAAVGISPNSGTMSTYLSRLRSNQLIETHQGELRASASLFL